MNDSWAIKWMEKLNERMREKGGEMRDMITHSRLHYQWLYLSDGWLVGRREGGREGGRMEEWAWQGKGSGSINWEYAEEEKGGEGSPGERETKEIHTPLTTNSSGSSVFDEGANNLSLLLFSFRRPDSVSARWYERRPVDRIWWAIVVMDRITRDFLSPFVTNLFSL